MLPFNFAVIKPDIQTRVPSRPAPIQRKETPSPQLSREHSREPSPQAFGEPPPQTPGHEAMSCDGGDDHITMQLEMKRFLYTSLFQ